MMLSKVGIDIIFRCYILYSYTLYSIHLIIFAEIVSWDTSINFAYGCRHLYAIHLLLFKDELGRVILYVRNTYTRTSMLLAPERNRC